MSHVDLHLHLLPGVDDGARTLDESLAHARKLTAQGIRDVTATPHVGHPWLGADVAELPGHLAGLRAALAAEGIPLAVHPGGEIFARAVPGLSDAELDAVAHGPAGARWVLIEIPFEGIDEPFTAALGELRARGYGALIAHPERAEGFLGDGLARLRPELAAGALLQVNADSLLGLQGAEARAGAERLVRDGLAHVLGSDGHPGTRDQTVVDGAAAARAAGAGAPETRRLTQGNPRFLLTHGMPAVAAPDAGPAHRRTHAREIERVVEARRRALA
jgi:protein-tyrosine phosphatase